MTERQQEVGGVQSRLHSTWRQKVKDGVLSLIGTGLIIAFVGLVGNSQPEGSPVLLVLSLLQLAFVAFFVASMALIVVGLGQGTIGWLFRGGEANGQ